jgi:putative ABC transport system permease protein
MLAGSLTFALKRLRSHLGLALAMAVGQVAAVALALAVPIYADGVQHNLLNAALAQNPAGAGRLARLPSFTFIFHYVGAWYTPISVDQYTPADAYLRDRSAADIGLPLASASPGDVGAAPALTRYVSTGNLQLYPDSETLDPNSRLDLVKLAFVSGIFGHLRLVDGALPQPAGGAQVPLEVLVSLELANQLGLQAGATYQVYRPAGAAGDLFQQRVRVAGIWVPLDATSPFWFYPPESFEKRLLLPEATFFETVAPNLAQPIDEAVWALNFDGSGVHSEAVPGLLRRAGQVQTRLNALLAHTDLESSPLPALNSYRRQALALTGLLFVFSAPVLGLAFYFLGLAADIQVRRQRNEIALLRSRGASRRWVAAVYLTEWAGLALVALVLGAGLGRTIAGLVSQTVSFLDFTGGSELPLRLTRMAIIAGLLAVGLGLASTLFPLHRAAAETIVSFKRARARAHRQPGWRRYYLDFLLLAVALYGLYTLHSRGALWATLLASGPASLYSDPLYFLLPVIFVVALALLALRGLSVVYSALAWLAAQAGGAAPVLALRQLARSPADHLGPLLLLIVTLALSGFVATMAHSLDRHLADQVYYQVGADLSLVEGGETSGGQTGGPAGIGVSPGAAPAATTEVWNFLPVADHLTLPGVQAATRVGRYDIQVEAGGRRERGQMIGVDRADFPAVAFFRPTFAGEPLVALMNRLASDPAALLVDRATWGRLSLSPGDTLQVSLPFGDGQTLPFHAAGVVDYFPTLYPQEGPFFIANLEYLFEATGGLQPYDVWLRMAPGADPAAVTAGLQALGVAVIRTQDAAAVLDAAYAAPNRQGMLGLLSAGFLAAAALTVLGFFLYSLFSYHERMIQLGVLRAIGLPARQMVAALALEQLLVIAGGLAAGTAIAVLASILFIPHLPAPYARYPGTPPFVVIVAWGEIARIYTLFAALLFGGIGLTFARLRRMKIFQAVKLGETG